MLRKNNLNYKPTLAEILKLYEWENQVNVLEDFGEVFDIVCHLLNKVYDSENYYKIPMTQ